VKFIEKTGIVVLIALILSVIVFFNNYDSDVVGKAGDLVGGALTSGNSEVTFPYTLNVGDVFNGVTIPSDSQLVGKKVTSANDVILRTEVGDFVAYNTGIFNDKGVLFAGTGTLPGTGHIPSGTTAPAAIITPAAATQGPQINWVATEKGLVFYQKDTSATGIVKFFNTDDSVFSFYTVTLDSSLAAALESQPAALAQLFDPDKRKKGIKYTDGNKQNTLVKVGNNLQVTSISSENQGKSIIQEVTTYNTDGKKVYYRATRTDELSTAFLQEVESSSTFDPKTGQPTTTTTTQILESGSPKLTLLENKGSVLITLGGTSLYLDRDFYNDFKGSIDLLKTAQEGLPKDSQGYTILKGTNGGTLAVKSDLDGNHLAIRNADGANLEVREMKKDGEKTTVLTEKFDPAKPGVSLGVTKEITIGDKKTPILRIQQNGDTVRVNGKEMNLGSYDATIGLYLEGKNTPKDAQDVQFVLDHLDVDDSDFKYVNGVFSGDKGKTDLTRNNYNEYTDSTGITRAVLVKNAITDNDLSLVPAGVTLNAGQKIEVLGTNDKRVLIYEANKGISTGYVQYETFKNADSVDVTVEVKYSPDKTKIDAVAPLPGSGTLRVTPKTIAGSGFVYEINQQPTSLNFESDDRLVFGSDGELYVSISGVGGRQPVDAYFTTPDERKALNAYIDSDEYKKARTDFQLLKGKAEEYEASRKKAKEDEAAAAQKGLAAVREAVTDGGPAIGAFVSDLFGGIFGGGFLKYYKSEQALSNLLIQDVFKSNWIEEMDQLFAKSYLGIDYWASAICRKEFDVAGDSVGMVEVAPGLFQFIAHVEGQHSEKQPMLCDLDNTEKPCGDTGTCRTLDQRCVQDRGNADPADDILLTEILYKFTYAVQAPSDEKLTPQRNEEGAISFNVVLRGPGQPGKLYDKQFELKNGAKEQQVIVARKQAVYTEVCIVFFKKPENFDGKDVRSSCVPITDAEGRLITVGEGGVAVGTAREPAKICDGCF